MCLMKMKLLFISNLFERKKKCLEYILLYFNEVKQKIFLLSCTKGNINQKQFLSCFFVGVMKEKKNDEK